MTEPQPPQPQTVLATITGKDLLDRLDGLTNAFQDLTRKLDDIPGKVADHEKRIRTLEGYGLADHDTRIAQVERGHWARSGSMSLGSALLSSGIVAAIIEVVHK